MTLPVTMIRHSEYRVGGGKLLRVRLVAALCVVVLGVGFAFLPSVAFASGLRVSVNTVFADDASYDAFSTDDRHAALDASFSYTVIYLGRLLLLDLEAGYMYHPRESSTLFVNYKTGLTTHAAYGGVRLHLRVDKRWMEWFQPFGRINVGWMWAKAELSPHSGRPSMYDWGSGGTLYVGGGIQTTVPAGFFSKRISAKLPHCFSIGLTLEVGYFSPQRIGIELKPEEEEDEGEVEPISVRGPSLGSLDLGGVTFSAGLVVTF